MIWSDQNSANLRSLVDNSPLIAELNKRHPKGEGKTFEQVAMDKKERDGYERCIDEIVALSEQKTATQQTSPFLGGLDKFEQRPPQAQPDA